MGPEPPAASLNQRILSTWQQAFPELTDPVDEPGTSILSDPQTPPTAWVSLWPVGQRVVARVAPDVGIGGEHELRLLDGPRVVLYRYSLDNLGSARVADSLALAPLGVAESMRPVAAA